MRTAEQWREFLHDIKPENLPLSFQDWKGSFESYIADLAQQFAKNDIEIEEEVAIASLPPAVNEGLTKAAGKGTIEKVESLTKKGKIVAYEAVVKTGTKKSEVQVGPDGKKLDHEE